MNRIFFFLLLPAFLFCSYAEHQLDDVTSCDVELLLNGGYAPLK